jgi:hypothetical protein
VWCVNFTHEGVFIGLNGTSTKLESSFWCHVEAGRPSHVVDQPGGAASTDSAFSSACRQVATKARAKPPQTLTGWPLGPLSLGSGPLGPRVKYTLVVMMILTFSQLHFVIP